MTTRRVVTGINTDGKSYFVHDGPTPGTLDVGMIIGGEIWVDDPTNPDPTAANDPVDCETFYLEPPVNGSVMRVLTWMPQGWRPELTEEEIAAAWSRVEVGDAFDADHPGMHTTPTIDYGIVLCGEINLELDTGTVRLGPGDVVVQRGTRHAWRNRGTESCTVAFVLISSPNYR